MPCALRLPLVLEQDTLVVGLYDFSQKISNSTPALLDSAPLVTRVFKRPSWKYIIDSAALNDVDDVWDIQQWRKADVEIAPMAKHELLRGDLLYIAQVSTRTQPLVTYLSVLTSKT